MNVNSQIMISLNTNHATHNPDPVSPDQKEDENKALPRTKAAPGPLVKHERKSLHEYSVQKKDKSHGAHGNAQPGIPISIEQINKVFRQLAAIGEFSGLIAHMEENSDAIDINGTSSNGNTALHWASQRNHRVVVKTLLSRPDINMTAVNRAGKTPAQMTTDRDLADLIHVAAHPSSSSSIKYESKVPIEGVSGIIPAPGLLVLDLELSHHSTRAETLSLQTMQQRFKISEDFLAILKALHPSVPQKGQIVELACGASHSAGRYHELYGQDIHVFGVDESPINIKESEYYVERMKEFGMDLQFHVGCPSVPDHAWPETVDLCVLRNPPLANTSRIHNIINTAADQCNQLLITSFNNSSLERIITLANDQFTVEKKIHRDGHVPWPELGAFDSSAVLLKRRDSPFTR